ncbi:CKLF-like MARVEL transmembrane domain-containing protein 8 isoform X1 [Pieris rapae]|uniref:CKLF-like MARVEL transmembrane domain-containing protein 8 isoform X1 n=1 Tax=Pieris rapae TaxID=64459 RepID=UPI001E2805C8|nr:CKLF-like MARVEL transmembrane domain-containing protein 8 isoform X1 [Pieris rapae]
MRKATSESASDLLQSAVVQSRFTELRAIFADFPRSLAFWKTIKNPPAMSHTVTITRTTATTSGTPLFVNTGYLGTVPGLLKLAQLILGAACVGVVSYYFEPRYVKYNDQKPELFFLLISVAFLIGTFCLLLSCVMSFSTATMISKTLYEVVYHGIAFVLYLAAGLTLLIEVNHRRSGYRNDFEPYLAAAVMGLVMAILYLFSTFLANRSYRGL